MADTLTSIPRILPVDESCGCSLTNRSVTGLTPATLAAQGWTEHSLASEIARAKEAKALGVQERGLTMLLKSNIREIGKKDLGRAPFQKQSIILPYIMRPQEDMVNNNYWSVLGGNVHPNAGTGTIPNSAYQVTVGLSSSPWQNSMQNIERYFLPGMVLYILTWNNTAAKTAQTLQYTILSSANADVGTNRRALLSLQPNVSSAWWAAASASQRAVYQPTYGQALIGPNNVDDREAWCQEMPAELAKHLLVNWFQTTREAYCTNKEYRAMLNLIMDGKVNEYLRTFRFMDLATQNKKKRLLYEKAWLNGVFFNNVINENQTVEGYTNLPTIDDPWFADCQHGYKANAIGIYPQLKNNNRYLDLGGGQLDMDTIKTMLYTIKRHRQQYGDDVDTIDIMVDRIRYGQLMELFSRYYNLMYGYNIERHAQINQTITYENQVLFTYSKYPLVDEGIQLGVFTDHFFDDFRSAFRDDSGTTPAGFRARGNMIFVIDWSDIAIGIGPRNNIFQKYPNPNEVPAEWACVMEKNWNEYNLRSTMWTVYVDRPMRHLVIENFSDECPKLTAIPCTPASTEEESPAES